MQSSRWLTLLAAAVLAFGACQPAKRLTKANVDEVSNGMAKKQVESILGLPTSVDSKDLLVYEEDDLRLYDRETNRSRSFFQTTKWQSKESNLHD